MTLPLTPELAPWVVPSSLGVLALLLSTYLVFSVRRRRLAEVADLEDVDDLPVQADDRDVRVLKRQVDVLTRTLAEWDSEQRLSAPGAPRRAGLLDGDPSVRLDPSAPSDRPVPGDPPTGPVEQAAPSAPAAPTGWPASPTGPSTAYAALSRELAAAGDPAGAVLAQWAADLQVLRPALGAHGADLARAVSGVRHDEPVAALRACREAALGLVRTAGSVRALLAPLDHLAELGDLRGDTVDSPHPAAVPTSLPGQLLALLPADQRERLAAAGLATSGMAG